MPAGEHHLMEGSAGVWWLISTLAVWRATHLLHAEDGPWDVFLRVRRLSGGGTIGRVLDCFYCLSLWVAAPFALLLARNLTEGGCLWLGLSGGAILLQRATESRSAAAPRWSEAPAPPQPTYETGEKRV
jgi:hypothetical protein